MTDRSARLLVVLPSWIGDAVMATPTLRRLRDALPGAYIGGLARPAVADLLRGSPCLDELHADRPAGLMGPKRVAAGVRPRRYGAALLLTNSFSTALVARLAGIPRRVGYDRDGRGILLTDREAAPVRPDGSYAAVPAVRYYWDLASRLLADRDRAGPADPVGTITDLPPGARLELPVPAESRAEGLALLARAGLDPGRPFTILCPGGNNAAKRWPADRFAEIGKHLRAGHGLPVLVTGSPEESDVAAAVASGCGGVPLPALGVTIPGLVGVFATGSCRLIVTNDTGPRHIAAALGVPVVSIFGPTDPRWTRIPAPAGEQVVVADPSLPEYEIADDHPDRCRIDRVTVGSVRAAVESAMGPV